MKILETNKVNSNKMLKKDKRAQKVAQDFEAFFVNQLLGEMSKSINSNSSNGNRIFKSMYYEEISKEIAKKSDFGIENILYNMITKNTPKQFNDVNNNFSVKKIQKDKNLFGDIQKTEKNSYDEKKITSNNKNSNMSYIEKIVDEASKRYGVKKSTIMAIIEVESNFNSKAKSSVGAKGLMQLMDSTAEELGVKNVWSIRDNIMGGTKYYSQLQKKLGDKKLALAAYNAGIGNIKKYGGIPPFKETQNYIGKVIAKEKAYNKDVKYE
jgi:soluble lytic murein transglycosylase-like protein